MIPRDIKNPVIFIAFKFQLLICQQILSGIFRRNCSAVLPQHKKDLCCQNSQQGIGPFFTSGITFSVNKKSADKQQHHKIRQTLMQKLRPQMDQ
jgi:hypothetical protein